MIPSATGFNLWRLRLRSSPIALIAHRHRRRHGLHSVADGNKPPVGGYLISRRPDFSPRGQLFTIDAKGLDLIRFGVTGLIESRREVPTFLLMRLAFGAGLCRFEMFRAVRGSAPVGEMAFTFPHFLFSW